MHFVMLPPYIADIAHRCFNDRGNRQLKHLKQLTTEPVCLLSKYQFEQVHLIVTPTDVTLARSPLQPLSPCLHSRRDQRERAAPAPRSPAPALSNSQPAHPTGTCPRIWKRREEKSSFIYNHINTKNTKQGLPESRHFIWLTPNFISITYILF